MNTVRGMGLIIFFVWLMIDAIVAWVFFKATDRTPQ